MLLDHHDIKEYHLSKTTERDILTLSSNKELSSDKSEDTEKEEKKKQSFLVSRSLTSTTSGQTGSFYKSNYRENFNTDKASQLMTDSPVFRGQILKSRRSAGP